MTSELKLFSDLLWVSHEKPWDYKSDDALDIYTKIGDQYPPFGRDELEAFLPSTQKPISDFASTRRFLYLKPSEGQPTFVPVLSLQCDFTFLLPEIRLRLGLFMRQEDEVKSIGLRFESPEGQGVHHYYHAQFITSFYDGAPLRGALPWLPLKQPALALNADGPVGLLLSLLVSLYGLDHVTTLAVALTGDLRTYVNEFMPDHWLVRAGRENAKYKTWKSADRFKTRTEARYRHCSIVLSDAATYQANDGRVRLID